MEKIINNLIESQGLVVSGKTLNHILNNLPLLKFMNDDDMIYQTGKNTYILEFDPSRKRGISCTTLIHSGLYYKKYGKYARSVQIEDDAMVYVEMNKIKCNKVILGEKEPKKKLIRRLITVTGNNECAEYIVKMNSYMIKYIDPKQRTEDMIICAIKSHGSDEEFDIFNCVKKNKITTKIIFESLKVNGFQTLKHIDYRDWTIEMIKCAAKYHNYDIDGIDFNSVSVEELVLKIMEEDPGIIECIDSKYRNSKMLQCYATFSDPWADCNYHLRYTD